MNKTNIKLVRVWSDSGSYSRVIFVDGDIPE